MKKIELKEGIIRNHTAYYSAGAGSDKMENFALRVFNYPPFMSWTTSGEPFDGVAGGNSECEYFLTTPQVERWNNAIDQAVLDRLGFPLMARTLKGDKMTVLFTDHGEGTVIVTDSDCRDRLGEHSYDWTTLTVENGWDVLPKSLNVNVTV